MKKHYFSQFRNMLLPITLMIMGSTNFLKAQCATNQKEYIIEVTTGSFASELAWALVDGSGVVLDSVAPNTLSNTTAYTDTVCLTDGASYTFRAYDTFGDGWNGGVYNIYRVCDNNTVADNGGASPDNGVNPIPTDLEVSETFNALSSACPNCLAPSALMAGNVTSSTANVQWTDNNATAPNAWQISYGTQGTMANAGTKWIVNGTADTVITGLTLGARYDWYVRAICGSADTSSWSMVSSFTTVPDTASGVNCVSGGNPFAIFSEEFDNNNAGWTGDVGFGNGNWEIPDGASSGNTGADNAHSGANYMNYEASSTSANNGSIVSPAIDLSGGADAAELSFWMHAYGASMGTLNVGVGTAASGPFTNEFTWTGPLQTAGSDPWVNVGVDLSSYLGQTIYIELTQHDTLNNLGSGFDGDMSIDLFEVTTCLACVIPSNLSAANLTSSSADLDWTENGTATQWEVSYDTTGFMAGTGNQQIANSKPLAVTGLNPNTAYDYYVRAICGPGDTSSWSAKGNFQMPCSAFTAPFLENFASTSGTTEPSCWSQSSVSNDSWEFGTGVDFGSTSTRPDATGNTGEYANIDFSDDPDTTSLITPVVDVAGLTTPRLTFFYNSQTTNTSFSPYNRLIVDYWDGSSWVNIAVIDTLTPNGWSKYTFDVSTYTFNSNFVQFRFSAQEGGAAVGGTGTATYDQDLMLDEVVVEETPNCLPPSALTTANLTSSSVDLGWTENNTPAATSWQISYGTAGFTAGAGTQQVVNSKPLAVTGLNPNTAYDYYVRAICGSGDTSSWSSANSFTTLCIPFTAPYTQNFDGTTAPALDGCWSSYIVGSSAAVETDAPSFGTTPRSAPNQLFLDNGSRFSNDTTAAITPQFTDMTAGDKRIRFWTAAEFSSNNVDLWVGTMTDPTDGSTISILDTVVIQGNDTYFEVIFNLDSISGYNGTDQHVVLMHDNSNSFDGIMIDDFTYESKPACPRPLALAANNITGSSATLTWNAVSAAASYDVIWGTAGFDPSTGGTTSNTTSTSVNLTGLSSSTAFEFYVISNCGGQGTSDTSGPANFATSIAGPRGVTCNSGQPVAAFNNDLESNPGVWIGDIGTGNGDWQFNTGGTGSSNTGPSGAHSGSQYIFVETSTGGADTASLLTPAINLSGASDSAELSFWLHAYGATIGTLNVGVGTSASGPFTQVFTTSGEIQTADTDPWQNAGVRLDSYVGQTIYIQFEYIRGSSFTGDFAIDLVQVNSCFSCANPTNLAALNISDNTALLTWNDVSSSQNYEVIYDTAGFDPALSGNSTSVTNDSLLVSGLNPTTDYDFYVMANCGSGLSSDTAGPATFTTHIPGPAGVNCITGQAGPVFTDDLETNPGGWTGDIGTGNGQWQFNTGGTGSFGTGPSAAHSGQQYLYVETSTGGPDTATLISPAIDLTFATDSAELSFWLHAFGATTGSLSVGAATSASGPFKEVFAWSGELQTADSDPWQNASGRLDSFVGQTVYLQFEYIRGSSFTGDLAIDLVEVNSCVSCPLPSNLTASGVTSNNATISWMGSASDFDLNWGPAGFAQGSATSNFDTTSANNFTLTGLASNTSYDVYLRSNCTDSGNGFSGWIGPLTFSTSCATFTAPFTESFDQNSSSATCWTNETVTGSNLWTLGSGSTGGVITAPHAGDGNAVFTSSGGGPFVTKMVSPLIDISALTQAQLSFWYGQEVWFGDQNELRVYVRDSGATSWTQVFVDSTNQPAWIEAVIDLPTTTANSIQIAFEGEDNFGRGNVVDEVELKDKPSCNAANTASVGVTAVASNSASIIWAGNGTGDTTRIIWGLTGFTPPAGTVGSAFVSGNDSTYTITGLSPQTTYDFYIQDSCFGIGASPLVGPITFTTACLPVTAPFTESFDTASATIPCWSNEFVQGTNQWTITTGGSSGGAITAPFAGTGNAVFTSSFGGPFVTRLVSPIIDVSSLNTPFLKFYYGHEEWFGDQNKLRVYARSVGGNWNLIFGDSANTASWTLEELVLPTTLSDSIQIAFEGEDNFGRANVIDEMTVEEAPSCPKTSNLQATGIVDTAATLNWNAIPSATQYEVWVGSAGFFQGTQTSSGGFKAIVNAPANSLLLDTLSSNTCYDFLVRSFCTAGDTSDWVGPVTFCTPCAPLTAPFLETFESTSSSRTCWFNNPSGTSNQWTVGNGSSGGSITTAFAGSANAVFTSSSGGPSITRYVSPTVNISTLNNPQLSFWYGQEDWVGDQNFLRVFGRNQGDTTWTLLFSDSTNQPAWAEATIVLPSSLSGNIQIAFEGEDNFGRANVIDDVRIDEVPTCLRPSNFALTTILSDSASFSWTPDTSTSNNNFLIQYGTTGVLNDSGNVTVAVTGSTGSVGGLMSNTNYCFWVRDVCTPGDSSQWTGPICATTLCTPFTAPYQENFDQVSTGITGNLGNCWTTSPDNTTSFSFRTNSGATSSTNTGPTGDATSGNGIYLYTEATSGSQGDMTTLNSPLVDISNLSNAELQFSYHMYGATIDTLFVDVNNGSGWQNNVFNIVGQQQTASADAWRDTAVGLSAFSNNVQVRFRVARGSSFTGDVSIDDVRFADPITCVAPSALATSNITTTGADVSWTAGSSASNDFEVSYGINLASAAAGTKTVVNAATSITLANLSSSSNYCVFVREICAPGDTSFWTGPVCFTTLCTPFSLPFSENFDGSTWIADDAGFSAANSAVGLCWDRTPDNGTDYSWRVRSVATGSGSTGPNNDATGGNFVYTEASSGGSGDTASLLTPLIDMTGATNPELTFGYFFYGGTIDRMLVEANSGTGWVILDSIVGQFQSSGTDPWRYDTVNLSALAGSTVQLRFSGISAGCCGGDLAIDSVSVTDLAPACPMPTGLAATANVGCDSIEVDWTSNTGGSIVQWGTAGFTPGTGNFTGIISSPYVATGLTPGTAYDFWVADTCGGDTSMFAGPVTVTTANAPQPVAQISIVGDTVIAGVCALTLDGSQSQFADSFSWDFDNGTTSNRVLDTATFAVSGTFTIVLTVANGCGSDSDTLVFNTNACFHGLDENALSRSLEMYPNPTTNDVTIQFDAAPSSDATIRITDMRGRVMMERQDNQVNGFYSKTFDVSSLANGVYMVEITSGELRAVRRLNVR